MTTLTKNEFNARFSVVTPTFNALSKLKRCVGSVRGQSDVALEHIIQDAMSTDGTSEWLLGQADINSVSETDLGMYDAINKAWSRSKGEFLSWLNSDEQYLPGTLAKVQTYFDEHPEVDVVFGNYIVTDSQGRPVALRREIPYRRAYVVNGFLNMQSATIFYRRRLWDSGLLRLDSQYRYAADKDLILRLADSGAVIRHIPDYLSIFGIDGTNLSTHLDMKKEVEKIRISRGAFRSKAIRQIIMSGRRVERFLNGGYRSQKVIYLYAMDEKPHYLEVTSGGLGGRYSLADTEGHANNMRSVDLL